jgi:hypothetical protein
MIKMKVLNIKEEMAKLERSRKKSRQLQADLTVATLKQDLVNATPIDTGLARASWDIDRLNNNYNIKNTTEYIQHLNAGSSQQAPAYFIEKIALRYGEPLGTIVDVKE